jgi:hypothetical protein
VAKPQGAAIAAGFTHSTVLTRSGAVLVWASGDPQLRLVEATSALPALAARRCVAVSAAKSRTMVVTETGDVFSWEAKPTAAVLRARVLSVLLMRAASPLVILQPARCFSARHL